MTTIDHQQPNQPEALNELRALEAQLDHQQAAVEAGACVLMENDGWEDWPSNSDLGGNYATGTRDDEYRHEKEDLAKELITAATPHLRAGFAEEHGIGDATSRPLYDAKTKIGQLTNHLEHAHSAERSLRVANEGWQRENEELQDKIRAIQAVLHDWERDEDSKGLHQDILALLEGGGK